MPKMEKSTPSLRGPLPKNHHFTKGKFTFLKITPTRVSRSMKHWHRTKHFASADANQPPEVP